MNSWASMIDLYTEVQTVDEHASANPVEIAKDIRAARSGMPFTTAIVTMNQGLIFIEGRPGDYQASGIKFIMANCGFDGTGTTTCAKVMEVFGFGSEKQLFEKLARDPRPAPFTL